MTSCVTNLVLVCLISSLVIMCDTTRRSIASWSRFRTRSLVLSELQWVHYPIFLSPNTLYALPSLLECASSFRQLISWGFPGPYPFSGKAWIRTTHPQIDPHVSRYCNIRNGVPVPNSGDLVLVILRPLFGVLISHLFTSCFLIPHLSCLCQLSVIIFHLSCWLTSLVTENPH